MTKDLSRIDRVPVLLNEDSILETVFAQKSDKTARNYHRDYVVFAEFLGIETPGKALLHLFSLDQYQANATVLRYLEWLRAKKGYATGTIARRLHALNSAVKAARLIGKVSWRIEIQAPKVERRRDIKPARSDVFEILLSTIETEFDRLWKLGGHRNRTRAGGALRDAAIVVLLRSSAIRREEALSIDWPVHVDISECRVSVKAKHRRERVWQPTSRKSVDYILDYVKDSRGNDPGPLFRSIWGKNKGKRLDISMANKRISKWSKIAGIDNVTPHMFRHGSATDLLASTGDIRTVQKFLRQKNPRTTEGYIHLLEEKEHQRLAESLSQDGK